MLHMTCKDPSKSLGLPRCRKNIEVRRCRVMRSQLLYSGIRRTSSEVAGRARQRAQNLAWLGGEASPPSAEPRLCRRPPLPLPPSTAPFRHFVAPKFNATFFAPKNHQKAPTWIPKWSRGDHLELHGRAQTSKNKQKH